LPQVSITRQEPHSSNWLKSQGPQLAPFHWQAGYAAFSMGQSRVPALKSYIGRQEEHHQRKSLQAELRALLDRFEMAFDERYLWD
jgi:hypothetical protein